jgi:ABC-type glycerol-3-phosphate transport system substrate-binding protein
MAKRVCITVFVLLLVLVAAGCGPAPTAAPAPAEEAEPAEPAEAEPVTLRFWTHQNEAFTRAYEGLIAAYQEQHPNVTITLESFDYDACIQTLQTSMPAGEADIIVLFGTWTSSYAERLMPVREDAIPLRGGGAVYGAAKRLRGEWHAYGLPQEFNVSTAACSNRRCARTPVSPTRRSGDDGRRVADAQKQCSATTRTP